MDKEKLAPCPNCGTPYIIVDWEGFGADYICNKCGIYLNGLEFTPPRIKEIEKK